MHLAKLPQNICPFSEQIETQIEPIGNKTFIPMYVILDDQGSLTVECSSGISADSRFNNVTFTYIHKN